MMIENMAVWVQGNTHLKLGEGSTVDTASTSSPTSSAEKQAEDESSLKDNRMCFILRGQRPSSSDFINKNNDTKRQ